MAETLNWGVLGTGGIANDFAEALTRSRRCRVVNALGSPEKSKAFAAKWRLPAAATSLDELLADTSVGAVYIATPHPAHEAHAVASCCPIRGCRAASAKAVKRASRCTWTASGRSSFASRRKWRRTPSRRSSSPPPCRTWTAWPAMTWADTIGNMRALDAWRAALAGGETIEL